MPGGACDAIDALPAEARAILQEGRRAVLTTLDTRVEPHSVPVCYAIRGSEIVTGVDRKPKSTRDLVRVRNIRRNSVATLLVDRWDEDWSRLGWVMLRCEARIEPPGDVRAALIARYPQYVDEPPDSEIIVLRPKRISWWTYAGSAPR
jgi:PPOX class probable F420-dependent enzyme